MFGNKCQQFLGVNVEVSRNFINSQPLGIPDSFDVLGCFTIGFIKSSI